MAMKQPTIAVIGDEFRDRYWLGTSKRLSPEAPIPVVKIHETKEFHGGAGNVIANLLALGAKVVASGPSYESLPIKNRLVVDDYQLARWDENDEQPEARFSDIKLYNPDAVIISDYAKGSITYAVIEAIAALNLPTFIDTKRDPRDFDVIMNPTFFPNYKEYCEHKSGYWLQPKVILKKGSEGIEEMKFGRTIQPYGAYAQKVVSVCGAGDTVLAAYTFATVMNFDNPLLFAAYAAAVVVEKPWTAVATLDEIEKRCTNVTSRRS